MNASQRRRMPSADSGYALLMVVFLAAVMAIAATVAVPHLITQGRREMEEEMIWRGEQYVRAVRLYYRKNGRFPQSLEDLADSKGQVQVRYLRQAYKDPMNKEDGTWRLIYVAPNGQLIGSVTRVGLIEFPGAAGPGAAAQRPTPTPGKSPREAPGGLQPLTPGQPSGQVFGGNIIGVASKVERASIKSYNGRVVYREWEFIWDPTKEAGVVGQPGARPGAVGAPTSPPAPPTRPR
jgi:type II secretory pathway pseudopilin PulG